MAPWEVHWIFLVVLQSTLAAGHLLSGLHSKLAARSHLANELEDHSQVYIVASKCKEIINGRISFFVIRGSRCRYLFFTFSRGSLDPTPTPNAGGGRPLNFPEVHLPTCGLKSIYNPNLAYSASMSSSVWWASRNTWRQPHHSRHLQSKSCESWSSSEVKSDVAPLLSQAVLGAFANLGKEKKKFPNQQPLRIQVITSLFMDPSASARGAELSCMGCGGSHHPPSFSCCQDPHLCRPLRVQWR